MAKKNKGDKKRKKQSNPYSELGLKSKTPKNSTPSAAHLTGVEVTLTLLDGDRPGEKMDIEIEHIDAEGLRYTREWRGNTEMGAMPMHNVMCIERRLDKGKGENFDKMPFDTSKVPAWASEHVGEHAAVSYNDGGRTQSLRSAFIGTVDGAGVLAAYSSYGYEKLRFIPHARLVDMSFRLADDEDDE